MIKISCRTNLDVREQWPDSLPAIPSVGDYIVSRTVYRTAEDEIPRQVRLRVSSVTWVPCTMTNEMLPQIELGLSPNFVSVSHFDAWYDYIRGNMTLERYTVAQQRAFKAANCGRPRVMNPDLIHDAAAILTRLSPYLSSIAAIDNDKLWLEPNRIQKFLDTYNREEHIFPIRVEYLDGTQELINCASTMPVAKAFIITEMGVQREVD